ncbi:hypothetical protein AB0C51_02830 [Streptomyces pathocidini]|uniref:hypothetical protein n=1 Tax=Streptomyces pathocidini TaxID=1650571 RepID=UPI0033C49727
MTRPLAIAVLRYRASATAMAAITPTNDRPTSPARVLAVASAVMPKAVGETKPSRFPAS